METRLVLCDTDIWIEYFRKNIPVIQQLDEIGIQNLYASVITKAELQQWANNKEKLLRINKTLDKIPFIDIELHISQRFSNLFEKYFLEFGSQIPDTIIAATAIEYDIELFTLNRKHYKFYSDLKLISHNLKPLPYEPGNRL
jgi:predicted nucleic acid-binding protein